jgi:hypothetical protein
VTTGSETTKPEQRDDTAPSPMGILLARKLITDRQHSLAVLFLVPSRLGLRRRAHAAGQRDVQRPALRAPCKRARGTAKANRAADFGRAPSPAS